MARAAMMPAPEIDQWKPDLLWRLAFRARCQGHARCSLNDMIVGGPHRVPSKAGDRAIHEPGIFRLECAPAEPQPFGGAEPEIVDEDICATDCG